MKIAINGFGRIGRQVLKALFERYPQHQVVAINDITDTATNAHLFKYDSSYGIYHGTVETRDNNLVIDGKEIKVLAVKDPAQLPWKDLGIDLVVESTGLFTKREGAELHLQAGAKRVLISAPAKGEDVTVVLGVNDGLYDPEKHFIISNASCTTNGLAPMVKVINDNFKVKKGFMNTVHSYTNDQRILDLPHKDLRRARAAALSIIPTSTGAAKAVGVVIPELKGKLDGFSLRVPTPTVSIVDFVCNVEKPTTAAELNSLFKEASEGSMKNVLGFTMEPLVSVDFKGNTHSSIIDGLSTMVMDDMIKAVAWYDNEWGYSVRITDIIDLIAKKEPR